MTEEATTTPAAPPTTEEQQPDVNSQLANALWLGQQPAPPAPEPPAPPAPDGNQPPAPTEDVIDANEYLKQQLGFEDWSTAKTEVDKWRQMQQQPPAPQEFKFENDDSRKIFEALQKGEVQPIYDYLHQQHQLSKVDNLSAADAIKLHIQLTNPHYKSEDILDVFEEKYSLPEKPIQEVEESEDVFNARMNIYNQAVEKINRRIERDAFTAKDGLSKLKSQLVLPDIKGAQEPTQPNQKELEAKQQEFLQNFNSSLERDYQNFKGYNITAKDGEVELPVSYVISPEELTASKQLLQTFNVNEFLDQRWFDENGNPKINVMQEDLYELMNRSRIHQKIANEAAAQMKAHMIKTQNNINLNGVSGGPSQTSNGKTEQQQLAEAMWGVKN